MTTPQVPHTETPGGGGSRTSSQIFGVTAPPPGLALERDELRCRIGEVLSLPWVQNLSSAYGHDIRRILTGDPRSTVLDLPVSGQADDGCPVDGCALDGPLPHDHDWTASPEAQAAEYLR